MRQIPVKRHCSRTGKERKKMWDKFMSKDTADPREERRNRPSSNNEDNNDKKKIYLRLSSIERKALNTGSRSKIVLNKLEYG